MTVPDAPVPVDAEGGVAPLVVGLAVVPYLARSIAHARGVARMPEAVRDEVRRAGLVDATDVPTPAAQLVAETLAGAVVEIEVHLATPGGRVTALVFVAPAGAVLAQPASEGTREAGGVDDRVELSVHPAAEVPYRLTELLDVGARPHPTATAIRLPAGVLDELLGVPADEADEALIAVFGGDGGLPEGVLGTLSAVVRDARARWTATSQVVVDADRAAVRRRDVLDAGPSGWWEVLGDDASEVLVPRTGREVLAALESLLPSDDELERLVGATGG